MPYISKEVWEKNELRLKKSREASKLYYDRKIRKQKPIPDERTRKRRERERLASARYREKKRIKAGRKSPNLTVEGYSQVVERACLRVEEMQRSRRTRREAIFYEADWACKYYKLKLSLRFKI